MSRAKVAFLDRDGTINVEKNYIRAPEKVELESGSGEAVRRLNMAGFLVFGISNQSGVARGYMSIDDVEAVNARVMELVSRDGGRLMDIIYCPHHPEGIVEPYSVACACRKPGDAMVRKVADIYGFDLSAAESVVIGDKIVDIELGHRIGAKTVLVNTGFGEGERRKIERDGLRPPHFYAENLFEAANIILG